MLGDALVLILAPDHEAGDVLQEHQRNAPLAAQFDEVRPLERGFREQDAIVGDHAHRHAPDACKARDQGGAVAGLPFVEGAVVDDARDDLAHVEGLARIGGDDAVEFFSRVARLLGRRASIAGGRSR